MYIQYNSPWWDGMQFQESVSCIIRLVNGHSIDPNQRVEVSRHYHAHEAEPIYPKVIDSRMHIILSQEHLIHEFFSVVVQLNYLLLQQKPGIIEKYLHHIIVYCLKINWRYPNTQTRILNWNCQANKRHILRLSSRQIEK